MWSISLFACLSAYHETVLNVVSLLAHHSVCFQNNSRGLMEWLCWFKGITSLLCQNQHIICFTGTTRLSTTSPTYLPTQHNTARRNTQRWRIGETPPQNTSPLVRSGANEGGDEGKDSESRKRETIQGKRKEVR